MRHLKATFATKAPLLLRRLAKFVTMTSLSILWWPTHANTEAGTSQKYDQSVNHGTVEFCKTESAFPDFKEEHLQLGRAVWMDNCRNCHERGIAGAPIVTEYEAWKDRIEKGKTILYEHATNGFFGEDDSMMPAKGGNKELSDEQVKRAVDYMVAAAIYFYQYQ